jgi:hypothetical protein
MADWRQIQARIRKAKASTDAAAQLAELYERTRDAMVAFELARWQEKAGEHAEAARWYTAAAERFRRSQWKSKAEAALARLRAPTPAAAEPLEQNEASQGAPEGAISVSASVASPGARGADFPSRGESSDRPEAQGVPPSIVNFENASEAGDEAHQASAGSANEQVAGKGEQDEPVRKGTRRRGRRGGRNRRRTSKGSASGTAVAASRVQAENIQIPPPREKLERGSSLPSQTVSDVSALVDASDVTPPIAAWRARSRAGEPALASRMVHLESQLRRLLACPQAKLEQAESAPAGPGVLLLSDSDQVTHYYVESCQTLRIAIGNLVRGGRGAKDAPRLKERLAENLGIAESRVTSYLKEHCAVRWLQLDEGAAELAHFAIAVLRPAVNE